MKKLLLIYILLLAACYNTTSNFKFMVEELSYLDKEKKIQLVIPKNLAEIEHINWVDHHEMKSYFFSNKDTTETLRMKFYYNEKKHLLSKEQVAHILNTNMILNLKELYLNNLEIINKSVIKNKDSIQMYVEYSYIDESNKKCYGLSSIKSWVDIDVKIDFSKQLTPNNYDLKNEGKKILKLVNLTSILPN